jgi:DNA-binding GntR family transcriptional regulator
MTLNRPSTIDLLADELRREILDGRLEAGSRLRERELCETYGVARHSLRGALRTLAADGLVRIEPHRGASVARLDAADVRALYELRAALELEAAHLALERHGHRLPRTVHAALHELEAACERGEWSEVNEAHARLHAAIVAASESRRIVGAHEALNGEMRLFLLQLQPHLPLGELASSHRALVDGLEREGPAVLREHLRDAAETLVSWEERDRAGRTAVLPPARLEEGDATRPGGGRTL